MIRNEEAIICYFSEKGHNNFYYASANRGIIKQNCFYELLPWVATDKTLVAVKIKNKCVLPLTIDENNVKDIIPSNNNIVVWIEK